ncbi:hypothetical protein Pmani_034853 [Petrolisthes manimaculis]|uniref:Uncharacterized protein n=1 Tax=Petrolisthes manimaculis TaxID=1843537 RepID=A0AAE1NLS0_9EUCA|nr:hypothetical protein Pmani_034853 [Petrolisthes manimaculis]
MWLKSGRMPSHVVDYFLWHHFGNPDECNQDLVTVYKEHFTSGINPINLAHLVNSYINRTDLNITRTGARNIQCPTLNMTSNNSGHVVDTEILNGRMKPSVSSWMKIQDCGLLLDERPGKVAEALRLLLCGQGYVKLMPRPLYDNTASLTSRVVESAWFNKISEAAATIVSSPFNDTDEEQDGDYHSVTSHLTDHNNNNNNSNDVGTIIIIIIIIFITPQT